MSEARRPFSSNTIDAWLGDPDRFSLEPALTLTRGAFAPPAGLAIFGSIGDSAPDTWGRRLMQRAERRLAEREGRAVRTLAESDYLLGVADETRLGAFASAGPANRFPGADPRRRAALIELGRLLQITERILRDEETDEDLQLIFAPGSSLGGARPKASVIDQHGHLSIAKFPKETDEYSIEIWEEIALRLAERSRHRHAAPRTHRGRGQGGSAIPTLRPRRRDPYSLPVGDGDDRRRGRRTRQLSRDGRCSPQHGAQAKADAQALYRRVVFNVLISNVDDHLRNHGFLWLGKADGRSLPPTISIPRRPIQGAGADDEHRPRRRHLLARPAGGGVGYFGAHSAAGPRDHQRGRDVTATWRDIAKAVGARSAEINRMASAFEHDDLQASPGAMTRTLLHSFDPPAESLVVGPDRRPRGLGDRGCWYS